MDSLSRVKPADDDHCAKGNLKDEVPLVKCKACKDTGVIDDPMMLEYVPCDCES
jgi:hypothetical protein